MFSTTYVRLQLIKIIRKAMKKIILGTIAVGMFCFVGYPQDNNTSLALKRMLMVTSVEFLQRSTPKEITKENLNKQLTKNEVSKEGMLFLNKAFEFYKKEISTEDILSSYEGKESYEIIKYLVNGGQNVFGNLNNDNSETGVLAKWLKDILIGILEIALISINICNALPWPC
jgi:hypothetical protein